MKQCNECFEYKKTTEFHRDSAKSDGLRNQCKECRRDYMRVYYADNRDERLAYERNRRITHGDEIRARDRVRTLDRYHLWHEQAIEIYGGRCVECGGTEDLQFDHVNNDGAEHRAKENTHVMVMRIARSGRITDYELQLLCRPHHLDKTWGPNRPGRLHEGEHYAEDLHKAAA